MAATNTALTFTAHNQRTYTTMMKPVIFLKNNLAEMPVQVRDFLRKALVLFIVWKLIYHLLLVPGRLVDKPLTNVTATTTGFLYRHLLGEENVSLRTDNHDPNFPKAALFVNDKRTVGIADPCNGLELYVLYISFLACIPTSFRRQILFTLCGVAGIFVLNSFRCLGLAWLNYHQYAIADFAHHYLFKMIIYAAIFVAWIAYSRKYFNHAF